MTQETTAEISASNQSFQYLYSVATDAKIETIEKLRMTKGIIKKAFEVVNPYEMEKMEFVNRAKEIDAQIQLFHNAGKVEENKDKIGTLRAEKDLIIKTNIQPIADRIVKLILTRSEIEFLMNEMKEFLNEAKKMNTLEEMEMFDSLFTALESAEMYSGFSEE